MNANMTKGMERNKLLAVVLAIAMIACCITFVATTVDAAEGDETAAATELPAAANDVITLTEDVTLKTATPITNPVVIGDYTLTIKADVDVDLSFTKGLQHIFTIGTGSIVIDGGSLTITADNSSEYQPTTGQGNHVFYRATADYSTTQGTIVLKSGSLSVSEDVAVNGQLSAGPITYMIQGGSASFNGNGIGPAYFIQDAGSVSFDSNNGRLQVYYDLNGGSLAVDGNNSENPIFTPYAMDIAKGATLNVNGPMNVYTKEGASLATGVTGLVLETVANNGTMVIGANGSLDVPSGSTYTNEGQTNVYGSISGEGDLINNGKVAILSQTATVVDMGGSGVVDTSAISENATLSGRLLTSTTFTDRQIVTVTDNLTLVKGTVLTIEGTLVIPEGMTVTVEDGAQLIINGQSATVENNGNIIIQSSMGYVSGQTTITNLVDTVFGFAVYGGATVENNGTINAQYLPTSVLPVDSQVVYIGADSVLENNAQVVIGTESAIAIEGSFTNTASATFDMSGTIMSGTIDNAGIVNINGASNANIHINLTAVDAVANIVAVTGTQNSAGTYVSGSGYITVQDVGFKSPNAKNEYANVDDMDSVMVYAAEGFTAGGITVKAMNYTDDVNSDGKDETCKALDISGTYTVSATNGDVDKSSSVFRIYGENLFVTDSLNVGAGVSMNFGPYNGTSSTTNLTVSGTMNVTVAASASSTSTFNLGATGTVNVYVTGQIDSLTNLAADTYNLNMNAASYTTIANAITTYHYTTLENAVASGATTIDVYGNIIVNGEVEIASGVTVRQDAGSKIDISTTGYVTVADGGRIQGVNVDVSGSLYAANERTGLLTISSILSEVRSTNGTDALYTNLIDAMADAESGDTITLYSKPVKLENTSFTIKDGVTVDTDGKAFGVYGTNLTINGTLFINGSEYTVSTYKVSESYDAPSIVILNGYIKNTEQMTYAENDLRYPAGAYYTMTENGVPYYYVTTVANAASVINDTEGNTVLLDGKLAVGSVTFNGTEDDQAIINIAATAEITSGTITLNLAELNIASGAEFTATVTDGVGSVDVKIVDSEDGTASAAPTFTVTAEDGLTVTGTAAGAEMTVTGDVIANGLTVTTLAVDGTLTVEEGNTIVDGKLTITGTVNVVTGVLTVSNATPSTGNTAMTYVTGTLSTSVASAESTDNGTATLGPLYVGIGIENDRLVDGQAGTVSGNVTATIAYVSSDSTVPEKMISGDGMKSTQFYVDDALWMTAYTADASANKANVPNAPVTDAKFIGWDDAEGNTVYYSNPTGQQAGTSDIVVGSYDGKLYASIEYNVYNVQIIADSSIGSVAIDGVILAKNMLGYYATTEPLTAGQHTVTYTLAAGYEGTATLSSTNTEVSGMTFTLSGDFEETTYILTIGGATYAGSTVVVEGGNGGTDNLGLTDYLLIILVILIVIMAIIVALRLMRS